MDQDQRNMTPGRRAVDYDKRVERYRHRFTLAIAKNPVLAAMTIAILIAAFGLWQVLDSQSTISRQQRALATLSVAVQQQRIGVTALFCNRINVNARASNGTTDAINAVLLNSVKQSRALEPFYRRFGLPPYEVRLRAVKKIIRGFVRQKVPVINCKRLARQIAATLPALRACARGEDPATVPAVQACAARVGERRRVARVR